MSVLHVLPSGPRNALMGIPRNASNFSSYKRNLMALSAVSRSASDTAQLARG